LDRFCLRHPKLCIPNLMLIVVLGSAGVYLMDLFSNGAFSALISFAPYYILRGQVWRLVTFVFVPLDSNPLFLMISLYFYYFIGSALEREWGSTKFTVFYGVGVLLNILSGFAVYFPIASALPGVYAAAIATANMHYVNLSLFFAFATLYPNLQVLLFFIIPIKVKWLAWLDAALFAFGIVSSLVEVFTRGLFALTGVVIPLVAIANYFLFFWSDLARTVSGAARQARRQTSHRTVDFQQAARKAHQKGYIHKCAVCGKTDADDPNMEFRYCSKCNGYYCYCMEHINNHVHIQ